jgi:hypothetical protein
MGLEMEVRDFLHEIGDDLKKAETDIIKFAEEIEKEAGRRSNETQPRVKKAMAVTVRRTITELEKLEEWLKQ